VLKPSEYRHMGGEREVWPNRRKTFIVAEKA